MRMPFGAITGTAAPPSLAKPLMGIALERHRQPAAAAGYRTQLRNANGRQVLLDVAPVLHPHRRCYDRRKGSNER